MRKDFIGVLMILSFGLLLMSGCAKDQVKPDESMGDSKMTSTDSSAGKQAAAQPAAEPSAQKASQQQADQQQAAAQQQGAQQLAQPEPAPQQIETVKSPVKTINFDFDSYVLSKTARDILYNNADYLLKKYKGKVKLEGHCDERGSDEYNLALGENRAKAAMNYLVTLGVPADQLSIISYGKERPLDKGNNEEAWAKNRRVEFVLIK